MKCCCLCWLLKECLNKKSNSSVRFDLPGTHGTYYAWIPPPGVPDEVLRDLRDELVRVVYANLDRQVTAAHSRHSSIAGYESGREEYLDEDAFGSLESINDFMDVDSLDG